MNRRTLFLLGFAGLLGGAFLLMTFQDGVRRSLMLTTADPNALGLVGTTSMEPIAVTLHRRRPATEADGEKLTPDIPSKRIIDRQITFKAPVGYFNVLDLKEGPAGPQRIGFSVWSGTFEPFQPDLIRALAARRAALDAKLSLLGQRRSARTPRARDRRVRTVIRGDECLSGSSPASASSFQNGRLNVCRFRRYTPQSELTAG